MPKTLRARAPNVPFPYYTPANKQLSEYIYIYICIYIYIIYIYVQASKSASNPANKQPNKQSKPQRQTGRQADRQTQRQKDQMRQDETIRQTTARKAKTKQNQSKGKTSQTNPLKLKTRPTQTNPTKTTKSIQNQAKPSQTKPKRNQPETKPNQSSTQQTQAKPEQSNQSTQTKHTKKNNKTEPNQAKLKPKQNKTNPCKSSTQQTQAKPEPTNQSTQTRNLNALPNQTKQDRTRNLKPIEKARQAVNSSPHLFACFRQFAAGPVQDLQVWAHQQALLRGNVDGVPGQDPRVHLLNESRGSSCSFLDAKGHFVVCPNAHPHVSQRSDAPDPNRQNRLGTWSPGSVCQMTVAQKTGIPKWLALLSGNMDQHLRFASPVQF